MRVARGEVVEQVSYGREPRLCARAFAPLAGEELFYRRVRVHCIIVSKRALFRHCAKI